MRYLCMVFPGPTDAAGLSAGEHQRLVKEDLAYNDEMKQSGHWIEGHALQPAETATTVSVRDTKVSVYDGPYAETKEQSTGFILIEATDLNDAIRVASRIPSARFGAVEIRPVRLSPGSSGR